MIVNTENMSALQKAQLAEELAKAGPVAPGSGEVHVNRYLTNLSIAVMQDPMGFVADKVFPGFSTSHKSNEVAVIDRKSYTQDLAELRAPGAPSTGIGHKVLKETYNCDVIALHEDVDDQTRANYDMPLNADDDAMFVLDEAMKISKEIRFSNAVLKTSAWASYVVGATATDSSFDASSSTTSEHNLQYLTNDAADPIKLVKQLCRHVMLTGGRKPTTFVMGMELFDALCEQADIVGRINRGQTPGQPAQATLNDLARLFKLREVLVMEGIYNSGDGTTATYNWIGDAQSGLLLYVPAGPAGIRMPQAGRTFNWTGYLGASNMGTRVKKFRMEHLESDRIEYTQAYDHKILDNGMGLYLSNVVG